MSEAAQGDLETTPIREAHRFDVKRLEAFCQQEVEGFGGLGEVAKGHALAGLDRPSSRSHCESIALERDDFSIRATRVL